MCYLKYDYARSLLIREETSVGSAPFVPTTLRVGQSIDSPPPLQRRKILGSLREKIQNSMMSCAEFLEKLGVLALTF